MKIATWNVNSVRVRLPQVLDWLACTAPDVLCLQETKVVDADFPLTEFRAAGYHAVFTGQKSYNGVATLSRVPADDVQRELPDFDSDHRRLLAASVAGVRLINVYVPNGEAVGSDKYAFKLAWLAALRRFVAAERVRHADLLVLGDFNIAPEPCDVHDPQAWDGQVLFSEPERAALRELMAVGLIDLFRQFPQPPASFTWWDYRQGAFRRNHGLRIDHILASAPRAARCRGCTIDKSPRALARPSDHAPVVAQFD